MIRITYASHAEPGVIWNTYRDLPWIHFPFQISTMDKQARFQPASVYLPLKPNWRVIKPHVFILKSKLITLAVLRRSVFE